MVGTSRTVDADPAFGRVIRLVSTAAHEFGPAISPDAKWVAYLSNARGPTDVWVKFIAGGDAIDLTATAKVSVQSQAGISGLEISPDGSQIAFAESTSQTTWVIPAPTGGVPRPILGPGNQGLRWSPDGKRMVYIFGGGPLGDNIILADGDGQNPREIVKRAGARHIHWLRWAPDGRFVYFNYGAMSGNTEGTEIFRASIPDGQLEPVVRTARRAAFPVPSPDGRGLLYAANPDSLDLGSLVARSGQRSGRSRDDRGRRICRGDDFGRSPAHGRYRARRPAVARTSRRTGSIKRSRSNRSPTVIRVTSIRHGSRTAAGWCSVHRARGSETSGPLRRVLGRRRSRPDRRSMSGRSFHQTGHKSPLSPTAAGIEGSGPWERAAAHPSSRALST